MSFGTYSALQTEILARLNRAGDTDAVARAPSWVTLAEDEMRLALKRLNVRQGETVNNSFVISSAYTALPTDYLSLRNIKLNTTPVTVLEWVAPQSIDRWDFTNTNSKPKYYTIQGNQIRVMPTPDASYTATLTYYGLTSLSVSNTSNWLLTAHPKLYFVASLAEAYDYYEDEIKRQAYMAERDRILNAIYTSDGSDNQGTNMVMRPSGSTP
jgi:hypothetical protein